MRFIERCILYLVLIIFILISLMSTVMVRNAMLPPLANMVNNTTPITPGAGAAASYVKPIETITFIFTCLLIALGIVAAIAAFDVFLGSHEEEFEPYTYQTK